MQTVMIKNKKNQEIKISYKRLNKRFVKHLFYSTVYSLSRHDIFWGKCVLCFSIFKWHRRENTWPVGMVWLFELITWWSIILLPLISEWSILRMKSIIEYPTYEQQQQPQSPASRSFSSKELMEHSHCPGIFKPSKAITNNLVGRRLKNLFLIYVINSSAQHLVLCFAELPGLWQSPGSFRNARKTV